MLRFIRRNSKHSEKKAPPRELRVCTQLADDSEKADLAAECQENAADTSMNVVEIDKTNADLPESDSGRESKLTMEDTASKETDQALYVVHDASLINGDVLVGLVGRSNSVSPSSIEKNSTLERFVNMESTPENYEYCDIRSEKPVYSTIDSQESIAKTPPKRHDVPNGDVYSVPRHVVRPRRPPPPPTANQRRNRRQLPHIKPNTFDPTYRKYRAALRSTSGKPKNSSKDTKKPSKNKKNDLKVSFRDDESIIQFKKNSKIKKNVQEQKLLPTDVKNVYDFDDNLSVASEDSDMSESELHPRRLRLRRTVAQMFAWIAMGLFTETIGPNMAYLMSRVNCTYDEISHPMMMRSGFMFLGAALGGVMCEVLPHLTDLWLAVSLVLGSGGIAAAPWCEDLLYLNLALGATGIGRGLLVVASLSYGSQVWPEMSYHLVVFLLHFCYAIGATAAPQLTYLFESGTMDDVLGIQANGTSSSGNGHQGINKTTTPSGGIWLHLPRAMFSFDVIAVFCFLIGAAFLALLGTSLANLTSLSPEAEEEIRQRKAENLKPISWFVGHELPGLKIIFFVLVFFVLPVVTITIFGRWLVEIAQKSLGMTSLWDRPTCLLVQTIFWGASAVGLIITPIARKCLPPNGLMITCTTLSLISTALLCVYVHKFVIFVWIFISLLGSFSAPFIPMGLTYCNVFVSQTPIGIALLTCLSSLSEILVSWQAAFLFHHFGASALLYLAATGTGLAFICYLPIIPSLIRRQWRPHPTGMKGGTPRKNPHI